MRKRLNCGVWPVLLVLLLSVWQTWAYYNPTSGRWLNRDPIGERGGLNLCLFVDNQPTLAIDDIGLAKHHVATMQLARSLPEGEGTAYLKRFTIPVSDPHYYDKAHRAYNPAVREFFESWLQERGVSERQFAQSTRLAEGFVSDVMSQPANSKIGGYLRTAGAGAAYWGGKALKGAVLVGGALGAGASVYGAYAGGNEFVDAVKVYKQDVERGVDSATLDLDAISAAVAVQTMTGDYFVTMAVLDTMLQ